MYMYVPGKFQYTPLAIKKNLRTKLFLKHSFDILWTKIKIVGVEANSIDDRCKTIVILLE